MTYTVTICDRTFANVPSASIQLEATTSGGTVLSSLPNGAIAGGFGAVLSFTPARQRFNIEIDTTGTTYAPLVLEDLNGDRHPQTINVILLPTPVGTTGPRPTSAAEIRHYMERQSWPKDEAEAVYVTLKTLAYMKRQVARPGARIRQCAELVLGRIGIDPDLVVV